MAQLAPSKNPKKESKQFGTLALVLGLGSLLFWPLGFASLAFGVRGSIISRRVGNKKYLAFSIAGIVLGLLAVAYYYSQR